MLRISEQFLQRLLEGGSVKFGHVRNSVLDRGLVKESVSTSNICSDDEVGNSFDKGKDSSLGVTSENRKNKFVAVAIRKKKL
jgi:hypothetical protein